MPICTRGRHLASTYSVVRKGARLCEKRVCSVWYVGLVHRVLRCGGEGEGCDNSGSAITTELREDAIRALLGFGRERYAGGAGYAFE